MVIAGVGGTTKEQRANQHAAEIKSQSADTPASHNAEVGERDRGRDKRGGHSTSSSRKPTQRGQSAKGRPRVRANRGCVQIGLCWRKAKMPAALTELQTGLQSSAPPEGIGSCKTSRCRQINDSGSKLTR